MSKPKEYLVNGDHFFPNTVADKTTSLPAGAYQIGMTMDGAPYFSPISIITDKIIDIPNSITSAVVAEIENFWSEGVSQKFKEYGLVQKRGVILEGPPGSGKTITLAKTAELVINKFKGVVLFNPDPGSLPIYLKLLKDIEPDKKVLVMWEEFDSTLRGNESDLLSLLDGEIQVDNIVYLATTNYISKIPARIKNRPSRFARIITVGAPDAATRRAFLEAKLTPQDKELYLAAMIEASDGFVIDQLKDLIISVCCFGYPISDAVLKIQEMQQDSMGIDDYNEEQANSVFGKAKHTYRSPLKPIKE